MIIRNHFTLYVRILSTVHFYVQLQSSDRKFRSKTSRKAFLNFFSAFLQRRFILNRGCNFLSIDSSEFFPCWDSRGFWSGHCWCNESHFRKFKNLGQAMIKHHVELHWATACFLNINSNFNFRKSKSMRSFLLLLLLAIENIFNTAHAIPVIKFLIQNFLYTTYIAFNRNLWHQ